MNFNDLKFHFGDVRAMRMAYRVTGMSGVSGKNLPLARFLGDLCKVRVRFLFAIMRDEPAPCLRPGMLLLP